MMLKAVPGILWSQSSRKQADRIVHVSRRRTKGSHRTKQKNLLADVSISSILSTNANYSVGNMSSRCQDIYIINFHFLLLLFIIYIYLFTYSSDTFISFEKLYPSINFKCDRRDILSILVNLRFFKKDFSAPLAFGIINPYFLKYKHRT